MALFNFKIILEIHHETSGITKIIFEFLRKFNLLKNLKYIFLHKKLEKIYGSPKDKSIILNDAVELDDFKIKPKKPLKTCVYTGSFVQGKESN